MSFQSTGWDRRNISHEGVRVQVRSVAEHQPEHLVKDFGQTAEPRSAGNITGYCKVCSIANVNAKHTAPPCRISHLISDFGKLLRQMDSSNFQQVLKVEGRHIALFFFKKKNNYFFILVMKRFSLIYANPLSLINFLPFIFLHEWGKINLLVHYLIVSYTAIIVTNN